MSVDMVRHIQRLILSPEKSFDLLMYVEQVALAYAKFGTAKNKHHKSKFALNILEFIDGFASEGRETSDSSTNEDSAMESTTT